MPLESLQISGTNLKELSLEAPLSDRDTSFDPDKDMPAEEKEYLLRCLERCKEHTHPDTVSFAYAIHVLGLPVSNKELSYRGLYLGNELMAMGVGDIELYKAQKNWGQVVTIAWRLAALGQKPPLSSEDLVAIGAEREKFDQEESALNIVSSGCELQMMGYDAEVPQEAIQDLRLEVIEHLKQGQWDKVHPRAAILKLAGKSIELGPQTWKGMKELLGLRRQEQDWFQTARIAANMTILSAGDIRMTREGLRLTKHKKDMRQLEPIPELRQFLSHI